MFFGAFLIMIVIAAFLGLLPAFIARNKGRNFWLWWIYGWLFFIIALIHVMFISDLQASEQQRELSTSSRGPARLYSLLAGLCFLIVALYSIFQGVWYHYIMIPTNMYFNVIMLAFAIVLFVGRWNIGVLVVSVLYALWCLPSIRYNIYGAMNGYSALLLAVLTAGCVLVPLRRNAAKMVKKAWFLPGTYFLLSYILQGLRFGLFYFAICYTTFTSLLISGGLFLMGLWLRASWAETRNQEPVAVIYTKPYPEDVPKGGASEMEAYLNSYQNLVDSGVMTKEEFEEKKRQLQRG